MNSGQSYIPIALESIETSCFPDVAIFIKNGPNHVLYKSHGRDFGPQDHERLSSHGVEFVFVMKEDMDVINAHMEASAERLLRSDLLTARSKGKMMYQTSVNFVNDIFSNPDKSTDLDRSKRLIENLMLYLSEHPEAIQSLESVMAHNYHTFVHSLHVTALTLLIHSEAYTLTKDEMLDVGTGAILHDIGKIFIPQELLNKTGRLSEAEIETIKRHPEDGYTFLKEKTSLSPVSLDIVRLHHERCNSSGYPLGLDGRNIPRSAQITGVADVYCTLTTDRNGTITMPPHMAIQIMRQQMNGAFTPHLLESLERLVCTEEVQQIIL